MYLRHCRCRSWVLVWLVLCGLPAVGQGEELTIAFWNIENLFDNFRDRRTPAEDLFSPAQLREKLRKDGEILRELNADLIGLMEVENRGVLQQLIDEELSDMGYEYFALLDEKSDRGIDVALVSRLPFLCYSFRVPEFRRGILVARFVVDGEPFYVLVNHWKSRLGGGADLRMNCAERVIDLVNRQIPEFEGGRQVPIIIGGDFNDNDDDPSVLHLEQQGLLNTLKALSPDERWTLPYFNRQTAEVERHGFDHVFINAQARDGGKLRWISSQVLKPSRMVTTRTINGQQYIWPDDDDEDHIGYSDHFPVMARFRIGGVPD